MKPRPISDRSEDVAEALDRVRRRNGLSLPNVLLNLPPCAGSTGALPGLGWLSDSNVSCTSSISRRNASSHMLAMGRLARSSSFLRMARLFEEDKSVEALCGRHK